MGDEISDPDEFNRFLDSLSILKEPSLQVITNTDLAIPEHLTGGATIMMVTGDTGFERPVVSVAAGKRSASAVDGTAKLSTSHATGLNAFRAGDLQEWATHQLNLAGRGLELNVSAPKKAKPQTTVVTADNLFDSKPTVAALQVELDRYKRAPLLAKMSDLGNYTISQMKTGSGVLVSSLEAKSNLALVAYLVTVQVAFNNGKTVRRMLTSVMELLGRQMSVDGLQRFAKYMLKLRAFLSATLYRLAAASAVKA